ncbi:murein L,D-transpeptidase catalytic domain family protein [Sphingomonas abietis]|uniref:Murein L,D-transpeptidase catalytic domain family protein n=1 Tax=Sphingomonas abietis TaxID=3012344 RepID=A0ABY7NTN1_9SPHN|nr:murein L,D-transpeptidase catalytic domain family protein [Sphingomonas abietis]WBO24013.1 murein L,D-transpeptidase catalytic domain family protein [Sphingomonas abietis]
MAECFLTRRGLMAMLATIGLPAKAPAAPQNGLAAAAHGVDPVLVARALDALARHNAAIWSRDVIAIADFGRPSAMPRLHLIDILTGTTTSLRVAHGKGSDPDHSGMLHSFSDVEGSAATSEGAYLTAELYTGVHGLSRRLIGLDPSDAHAEERAIVIHSAWYAGEDVAIRQGKLGRSDGCFAVSPADIALVLSMLGQGRLLYAGRA